MPVPQQLLEQLLALDEPERLEIAHTLLAGVEGMNDADREKLYAAIDRSLVQADAGQTVPFDEVMAALRAKRTAR